MTQDLTYSVSRIRLSLMVLVLIVYFVSAIFNKGYYHYDEHYQIIEFGELKLGHNLVSDLSWEYQAKIRSALQPSLVFVLFTAFRTLGLTDPYLIMIVLRLLTGMFAVFCISYFFKNTYSLLSANLIVPYTLAGYFLWFLPFINVRFSSETYSGLFFILSLGILLSDKKHKYLIYGVLSAVSFLFRFQTALLSSGCILWLIFINKSRPIDLFKICLSFTLTLAGGFFLDCWFYGGMPITFVNYFLVNIIDGVAEQFGSYPWYYYFTFSSRVAFLPFGIIIWLSVLVCALFHPRKLICWAIVPFLIVHILLPHKELRFLFPIVNLIPILFFLAYDSLQCRRLLQMPKNFKALKLALIILFAIVNSIALSMRMLAPADIDGLTNITEYIHKRYSRKNVCLWVIGNDNPYHPLHVNQNFYADKNVINKSFNIFGKDQLDKSRTNLIFIREEYVNLYPELLRSYKLELVTISINPYTRFFQGLVGFKHNTFLLYEAKM